MTALACRPAHEAPWADLEQLFGERGACGGCWCTAWRRPRKDHEAGKPNHGADNRAYLQALWQAGEPIGLLGYRGAEAVGWISAAPREQFAYFRSTRTLKPAPGDAGVWVISCLFVAKAWRRQGLSQQLVAAASDWALAQGARAVEAYPVRSHPAEAAPVFLWTGTPGPFERSGFCRLPTAGARLRLRREARA
jgi:GNAT superfamily N-acetyltransferase